MKPTLPTLGLGLSSNAQRGDVPRPYELLRRAPGAFDYLEYSAPLDVEVAAREATLFATMQAHRAEVPLVYHPVHLNLFGPALESRARLAQLDRHCADVGSPWVSNDVAWWHQGGALLPGALYLSPPLTAEALALGVTHARAVQAALDVPLLLENPTVSCARGPLHVLDFMARLSDETGCWMLLDVGHLVSHQLTRGRGLLDGLEGFDFGRVAQLHVAGGVITTSGGRAHYVDDHPQPVRDEVWQLLDVIAPRCTALRALTFEADGHPDAQALGGLRRLRPFAPQREVTSTPSGHAVGTSAPAPRSPSTLPRAAHPPGAGLPTGAEPVITDDAIAACWQLFDDVHAGRGDDVDAARAEQDFRLAVLAQALDAEVPWARLAVAAGREALAAFMTSRAFREGFAQGAALRDTFLRWARTGRASSAPGARALLDFEAWLEQAQRRPAELRASGLATGVRLATFDVDFSEVLFAARALGRHLRDRAPWSASGFEATGYEGLLQVAARAPRRPWTVALRPVGRRLEVFDLDDDELEVMRELATGASLDVPLEVARRLLQRGLVTRSGR